MILGGKLPGKVGRCRFFIARDRIFCLFFVVNLVKYGIMYFGGFCNATNKIITCNINYHTAFGGYYLLHETDNQQY